MKRIILAIAVLFMAIGTVQSAPFLVCDPDTITTSYLVVLNSGDPVEVSAPLHFDLSGIAEGAYVVEVQGKNIWGVSAASPLEFTKALPVSVINTRLSVE